MSLKQIGLSLVLVATSTIGLPCISQAENLDEIFKKVNEYAAQKNYSKAISELSWAQKELEKQHNERIQSFLPETLSGFKGQKMEGSSVMGFSQIERDYKGDGDVSVKVSLVSSAGAGGQAGGMGGLAALGQMAALMGNQPGVDTFRIDGRTASLETQSDTASLTIFLEGGSILKFEMSGAAKGDVLKKMASEIKIAELDTYLKGA